MPIVFNVKIATSATGSNAAFQISLLYTVFEIAGSFSLFLNHSSFTIELCWF